jgi:Na+/H+ antiporter NhaC
MRYALPAAGLALVAFGVLGGADSTAVASAPGTDADPLGLVLLLVPVLVLSLLLRRAHLAVGLFAGIGAAIVLGLLLGRFGPSDLMAIDSDNFIASGLLLDGMRRAFGVSLLTILLMGLVGGLQASGLLHRLVSGMEARARTPRTAGWWIFGSISTATLLTTHSAVAILAVGSVAREVGETAGIDGYRRANILDVTVCTYPFLLPFFIPTILAASMTANVAGMPRLSPWDAGLHNVHSWGLLLVLLVSLATAGREKDGSLGA